MNTIYKVELKLQYEDREMKVPIVFRATFGNEDTAHKAATDLAKSIKSLPGYLHTVTMSKQEEEYISKVIL